MVIVSSTMASSSPRAASATGAVRMRDPLPALPFGWSLKYVAADVTTSPAVFARDSTPEVWMPTSAGPERYQSRKRPATAVGSRLPVAASLRCRRPSGCRRSIRRFPRHRDHPQSWRRRPWAACGIRNRHRGRHRRPGPGGRQHSGRGQGWEVWSWPGTGEFSCSSERHQPDRRRVPGPPPLGGGNAVVVQVVGDGLPCVTPVSGEHDAPDNIVREAAWAPELDPLGTLHRQGCLRAFTDEAALQLGEHREDLRHGSTGRSRRIHSDIEGDEAPPTFFRTPSSRWRRGRTWRGEGTKSCLCGRCPSQRRTAFSAWVCHRPRDRSGW